MLQVNAVENLKIQTLCSIASFPENPVFCDIMWKNIVEPDKPQMAVWRMRIAYWMPKAINTTQNM